MKSKYLFPTWGLVLGYFFTIPGFVLGYLNIIKKYEIPGFGFNLREKRNLLQGTFENFTNELAIFLVIIGLLFIAFSKSKREDELNSKIRLNSLYWGIIAYYSIYVLIFFINAFLAEIPHLSQHYLELNIFTPLLIFIVRFNYLKYIKKDIYLLDKPFLLANNPTKKVGVVITLLVFLIGVFALVSKLEGGNYYQILYISFIIGLLLWAFSKHKNEDEMINNQRLESLQLAVYFNYGILLAATLLFYSINYLFVLMFAQFSLLLYFVIRMEYMRYKNTKILNTFEGEIGS